jgi:hypothetical protein
MSECCLEMVTTGIASVALQHTKEKVPTSFMSPRCRYLHPLQSKKLTHNKEERRRMSDVHSEVILSGYIPRAVHRPITDFLQNFSCSCVRNEGIEADPSIRLQNDFFCMLCYGSSIRNAEKRKYRSFVMVEYIGMLK